MTFRPDPAKEVSVKQMTDHGNKAALPFGPWMLRRSSGPFHGFISTTVSTIVSQPLDHTHLDAKDLLDAKLVEPLSSIYHNNCQFCDKSTTFCDKKERIVAKFGQYVLLDMF